jgi:hypothetical protein
MNMTLYVIKYKGNDHKGVNENYYKRFEKECGLRPLVLDEYVKESVMNFLETYPFKENVILHFQAHGMEKGIAKLRPGESAIGEANSLIIWETLVSLFTRIANRCDSLYVNLGTTCFSNRILPYLGNPNFDLLVSNTDVTNPVKPQQLNKKFILLSSNRSITVNTDDPTLEFFLKPNFGELPDRPIEPLGH